ncbi:asparagine synthase (glutamine-hydrolyzing) [Flavobacterium sp.]|uniref:asparagine synthase (glutamine-hydrolyzing) n=1 Tax=Flavobacterium sp. TaxID=239 RepID=UPI003B99F790
MCGIAGIFGSAAQQPTLKRMLEAQKHRGPDFTAVKQVAENGFLGHNRLSILDLSDAANQPFESSCGRYTIVFNGEIYNYVELKQQLAHEFSFRTQSDTEVLLAAYQKFGAEVTEHLNGMFAFAIYDGETKSLFAARDRFGVKPFYYYLAADLFLFASEIKPIFEAGVPKQANNSVWSAYLMYGSYGAPDETFWADIRQLPAGSRLLYQNQKLEVTRWYDFTARISEIKLKAEAEVSEIVEQLLLDATRLRFRADVAVGFNLSGGVDSSTLLSLIKAQDFNQSQINAFTFICNDTRYDELQWVRAMLAKTDFPLHVVPITHQEVPDLFEKISAHQLEPFGGLPTLAYAKIFDYARSIDVKVLLDGQGADEAWAGYDYYLKSENSVVQGTTVNPFKKQVLNAEFSTLGIEPELELKFESRLKNVQYRDLFSTKLPRALRFNDRVSMLYGTELREPFLDYRLVEYVFAQPDNFKIKDGTQKWLLRQIATKYLNSEIVSAPKRPLQTPQREWLSRELKSWVLDKTSVLKKHDFFESKALETELELFFKGQNQSSFHIWQYISSAELLFP